MPTNAAAPLPPHFVDIIFSFLMQFLFSIENSLAKQKEKLLFSQLEISYWNFIMNSLVFLLLFFYFLFHIHISFNNFLWENWYVKIKFWILFDFQIFFSLIFFLDVLSPNCSMFVLAALWKKWNNRMRYRLPGAPALPVMWPRVVNRLIYQMHIR